MLSGVTSPNATDPGKTAHERLRRWPLDGTWDKIFRTAVVKNDVVGNVAWIRSVGVSPVWWTLIMGVRERNHPE